MMGDESESVEWITLSQAVDYLETRFAAMHTYSKPGREAVRRWMVRGLIETHPHRYHSFWFTTYDWLDEAIMWKRIPPKKNRPPIAKVVERDGYTASWGELF